MDDRTRRQSNERILGVFGAIKRPIVIGLLFLMLLVIALVSLEVVANVVATMVNALGSGDFLRERIAEEDLLSLFGLILTIFVALELAESVEVYLHENRFHVGPVLLVALIAVARKIILVDYKSYPPLTVLGLAGMVVALAAAYWLVRGGRGEPEPEALPDEH